MDFPQAAAGEPSGPYDYSSLGRFTSGFMAGILNARTIASYDWPAANRAVYIPITFPVRFRLGFLWWINGATITSSHMDCGLYSPGGALIVSTGSTAQSGASAVQTITLATPILIDPGPHYLALSCDNTTGRAYGMSTVTAAQGRMSGLLQQDTAFPLPASMTAATYASAGMPLCGPQSLT